MSVRISATFSNNIELMARAYAGENGISFSESVEILTSSSVLKWWNKHELKERKVLEKIFENGNNTN